MILPKVNTFKIKYSHWGECDADLHTAHDPQSDTRMMWICNDMLQLKTIQIQSQHKKGQYYYLQILSTAT